MATIYPQEISAAEQILDEFTRQQFVILLAQMQSGKTNTFKLVACEMLRQRIVKRVVIFSGNREVQLTEQLHDRKPASPSVTQHKFKSTARFHYYGIVR